MDSLAERAARKLRRIAQRQVRPLRRPLRAAVVGCGAISPEHLDGYEDTGIAAVVGVSDVAPAALARALDRVPGARGFRDYREMLETLRPDVVSICTWPQTHADVVRAAVDAGVRGILCEKPLALTMAEVDEMVRLCREAGVRLAGGHQLRFHRAFVEAARLVRSGVIGQPRSAQAQVASSLANNGPHVLDVARFVLGDPRPRRVSCRCVRTRGQLNRGWPMEDGAEGQIEFENDLALEFRTGDLSNTFLEVTVTGALGELVVTPKSIRLGGKPAPLDADAAKRENRGEQFRHFVHWVKGTEHSYVADAEPSAVAAELVLAAYEAARVGAPVELPLAARGDVIRALYPQPAEPGEAPPARPALPHDPRLALDGGPRSLPGWFNSNPPVGLPELANLARVIQSGNLNMVGGQMVPALEKAFAKLYGCQQAVASTSGTAALHVALAAVNPEPCDEVITTPMTDMGTLIPILAQNCLPSFADIDPVTGNLTAQSIAERITPRTKAVILVHLFGRPAELEPIVDLCRARGIALIEDCSQAHLAEYHGKKVGTFGDLGCFSLQQSKQITCGDGGLTLVNRPELVERASLFIDKGWNRRAGKRAHLFFGMNYRMTELQAAVALAQLKRLPGMMVQRRQMAEELVRRLAGAPGVVLPESLRDRGSSWWKFNFLVDEDQLGCSADVVADALLVEGVRVARDYLPRPLFEEEMIRERHTYGNSGYPFSAVDWRPPHRDDFPGLMEFYRRQLIMSWSSSVQPKHVSGIAAAIQKVTAVALAHRAAAEPATKPQVAMAAN